MKSKSMKGKGMKPGMADMPMGMGMKKGKGLKGMKKMHGKRKM